MVILGIIAGLLLLYCVGGLVWVMRVDGKYDRFFASWRRAVNDSDWPLCEQYKAAYDTKYRRFYGLANPLLWVKWWNKEFTV